MNKLGIATFTLLILHVASVSGYSQNKPNRSLSVQLGIWKGYNTSIHRPANFTVSGVGMGGIAVSYEQKCKQLTYGITADFADINYATQSKETGNFTSGHTIGIGYGREELAASNIVVTLGISARYHLLQYTFYHLNVIANPRLGLLIYNRFYDDLEGNLNNDSRDLGGRFYLYNSAKQNRWPVPLIKLTIENEFRLSKRSALLFSVGYQKGFIPVFVTDRTYVSQYHTPDEKREGITVKTKASNISVLFGYRMYF